MLPIEHKIEHITTEQIWVTLSLPEQLAWFEGHFTNHPILPGVAQIEWVMWYAKQALSIEANFLSLERVKFSSPILPDDTIQLRLTWDRSANTLQFSYFILSEQHDEPTLMSSGKIRLCP